MLKSFKVLSIFAIIALGLLVYSNSFLCSFHFDDDAYIINNFAIRNIHNLYDIWKICPCRFITFLSLALNYHFSELNVFPYHAFNITVHLGTAILVWWLTLLTFSTPVMKEEKISLHAQTIALFAALVFISHPVQTEAVTYIWQRAALLAAFFYLLSLCFYIKSRHLEISPLFYKEGPGELKTQQSIYYILSLITAVIAMFTKENAITLPLMIILYEITFLNPKRNINWIQLYPFWIVLFIIPLTMSLTQTARVGEIRTIVGGLHGISPIDYLLTQLRVMITYIRLLILPIHLNLDYDYPIYKSFTQIPVLASFVVLGAILYLAKQLWSKYRLISFSILWLFLTLLPESSIIPQSDVIFEHRLYLPIVGYCLLLVSGFYYLLCRHERSKAISERIAELIIIILSLTITFNSVLTYQRNKTWKNEITLWQDVVQKSPHKARPHINRGWAYYNEGNDIKAMVDYNKAIAISPELIYPYDDRGLIYAKQGNATQAMTEYTTSIKLNPYYAKVYYHRALAFVAQKDYPKALSDFNKAIELDHEYIDAYNDRGKLEAGQANLLQARLDYTKSLNIDPNQASIAAKLKELN